MAEPYQLTAHYVAAKKGDAALDVVIADNDIIPWQSIGYQLQSITATLKSDDISLNDLANFRDISFAVTCNDTPCSTGARGKPIAVEMASAQKGQVIQLFNKTLLPNKQESVAVTIDVELHFTPTYLCQQESALRAVRGKPVKNTAPVLTAVHFVDDKGSLDVDGANKPIQRENTLSDDAVRTNLEKKSGPNSYAKWVSQFVPLAKVPPRIPTQTDAEIAEAVATLSGQAIPDTTGNEIFFSFCRSIEEHVDWPALAALGPTQGAFANQIATVRAANKAAMQDAVAAFVQSQKQFAAASVVVDDNLETAHNVVVSETHLIRLVTDMGAAFRFREVNPARERDLKGSVDLDASVRLEASNADGSASGLCKEVSCTDMVNSYISVSLSSTDNKGNVIQKDVALAPALGGDRWELAAALSDYLDKDVTLSVIYKNGSNSFPIRQEKVHVDNLGLITTFPVVTEVVSLVSDATNNKVNPNDPEWQSSIPFSYAFVRGKPGQHVAVTLPWMIGINTRTAPHLSDIIKVFPHVSAILPLTSDGTTEIAFGAGIAFVNTFTLSWGIAINSDHQNYLLVGVSVPDLVKALKSL